MPESESKYMNMMGIFKYKKLEQPDQNKKPKTQTFKIKIFKLVDTNSSKLLFVTFKLFSSKGKTSEKIPAVVMQEHESDPVNT